MTVKHRQRSTLTPSQLTSYLADTHQYFATHDTRRFGCVIEHCDKMYTRKYSAVRHVYSHHVETYDEYVRRSIDDTIAIPIVQRLDKQQHREHEHEHDDKYDEEHEQHDDEEASVVASSSLTMMT